MALGAISLALQIADKIQAQTDQIQQNQSKLRQLSVQAIQISNSIHEHYVSLDKMGVELPKGVNDAVAELELVLGKVLKTVEKERNRSRLKSWLKASSQAEVCGDLTEELNTCSSRFNMAANFHILGQTRIIGVRQEQVATRDEELLRAIVIRTTPRQESQPPASITLPMVELVNADSVSLEKLTLDPAISRTQGPSSLAASEKASDDVHGEETKGFEAFIECIDQVLSTKGEVFSPLQEAFAFFFQHVETHHSGLSICYAASETFAVEHNDEITICACVAVLKEELDLRPNFDTRAGNSARCRVDFIFDFTMLTVSDTSSSSPSDWIQVQGLANYFGKERVSFALWDLGRLPTASHVPDSDSFRWIRQKLSTIPTSSGQRVVVDVESGNGNHPLRRFHQLNSRIAHPSNALYRLDLIRHLDKDIRTACEDSNEDWFLTIIAQLQLLPNNMGKIRYLEAHRKYCMRSIQLEIEAFASMDIIYPLPTGAESDSSVLQPSFQQIQEDAFKSVDFLFKPFLRSYMAKGSKLELPKLTPEHLMHCRVVGVAWWKIHTSIVLLSSEGREKSSIFTRVPLAKARSDLAQMASPQPPLIWNYLPPRLSSRARHKRRQITQAADLLDTESSSEESIVILNM